MLNAMISSFRAAENEVLPRGGLFGLAGTRAQAFCDVVGRNPALQLVLNGFGKAVAFAQIISQSPQKAAEVPHLHAGLACVPA